MGNAQLEPQQLVNGWTIDKKQTWKQNKVIRWIHDGGLVQELVDTSWACPMQGNLKFCLRGENFENNL